MTNDEWAERYQKALAELTAAAFHFAEPASGYADAAEKLTRLQKAAKQYAEADDV